MKSHNHLSALHLARAHQGGLRKGIFFNTPAAEEADINVHVTAIEKAAQQMEKRAAEIDGLKEKSAAQEAEIAELKKSAADILAMKSALRDRMGGDLPGLADEKKTFDIGKLLQFRKGIIGEAEIGFELEVTEQTHKKYSASKGWAVSKDGIMSTLRGSEGGIGLPVEVSKTIIEAARAVGQFGKLGVYSPQFSGLSAITVPKEEPNASSHDGIIVAPKPTGEGQAFTLRTPKWKAQSLAPKKLMVGVGVTNEMFREGGQFLVDYVTNKAAIDFSNQWEFNVMNGGGVEGQVPKGLLQYDTLANPDAFLEALGNDGRPLSFLDLIGLEQTIDEQNRLVPGGNFGYYMRTSLAFGLRTQTGKATSGATKQEQFPITPLQFMSVDALEKYVGYKVARSTLIPTGTLGNSTNASTVVFGDWRYLWAPTWGPMEMLMSNVATVGEMSAFANDMTFVRFVQMYDSAVMADNAFTKKFGFIPKAAS